MGNRFFRTMFFLAALWNLGAALQGLFFPEAQFLLLFGERLDTGEFHQALLYRSFAIAVLLFGIGYYLVSKDTSQNRGIVWLGALGKVIVFAFFTEAFLKEKATPLAWGVSFGDLLWALLFFWFLQQTKAEVRVSNLIG